MENGQVANMDIEESVQDGYQNKLKGKLFGLLCEYEKGRDWEGFLDSILIELGGLSENYKTINYYELYNNLSSLRYLNYKYFRKTIFACINLVSKVLE